MSNSKPAKMNSSNDDSDEEFDMCLMLAACMDENEKIPYAARRDPPLMSGIQWVEARLKDPKRFYKSFRMRRVGYLAPLKEQRYHVPEFQGHLRRT